MRAKVASLKKLALSSACSTNQLMLLKSDNVSRF